jgi:hypothetical protein
MSHAMAKFQSMTVRSNTKIEEATSLFQRLVANRDSDLDWFKIGYQVVIFPGLTFFYGLSCLLIIARRKRAQSLSILPLAKVASRFSRITLCCLLHANKQ